MLFSFTLHAQDYVDIIKIGYGQTINNDFKGSEDQTETKLLDLDVTFPVVINEKNAFITGVNFSKNSLELFPDSKPTNLFSTTLKVGLATTFNEKWSTTLVLLPKVASDYETISSNDFYFGGFAILKLKKKENLIYRFGIYATSEAYGLYSTPIIGWYYLSPNKKFEMDMSLPISADVNYTFSFAKLGIDYFGIGRSYNVELENYPKAYVDQSSLEFLAYLEFNMLQKSMLFRAKIGYATSDNEVYNAGDNIDFGLTAFTFGDTRTQLNPDMGGGLLFKLEAIYRFSINNNKQESETNND